MNNHTSVTVILPLPAIMSSELNTPLSFSAYVVGSELIVGVLLAVFHEEYDHLSECVDTYLDNAGVNVYKNSEYQQRYDRLCKLASDMYSFLDTVIKENNEIIKLKNSFYYLDDVTVIPGGLLVRLLPPDYDGDEFTEHILTFNELPY